VWHVFSVDQAMTSQKPQYKDCSFMLTLFFKRAMSIEPSNIQRSGVEGKTLKNPSQAQRALRPTGVDEKEKF
jgi:hypothetical protein